MYDGAKLGNIAVGTFAFTGDNVTGGDKVLEFDNIADFFRRTDLTDVSNGADCTYSIAL